MFMVMFANDLNCFSYSSSFHKLLKILPTILLIFQLEFFCHLILFFLCKKIWNSMVKNMRFSKVCAWQIYLVFLYTVFVLFFLCFCVHHRFQKQRGKNVYCLSVVIAPHSTLKTATTTTTTTPTKSINYWLLWKDTKCVHEAILIEFIPSCNMQKRHLYSNQYFLAHKRLQNSSIFKHKFLKFPFL